VAGGRCVLDSMFDDNFLIRREFLTDERALRRRFRFMAVANVLVSPFLMVFLLIYFFLRNAENVYHRPSSVGARQWCVCVPSPLCSVGHGSRYGR
jgi:autophagy-related protein 9